MEEEIVRRISYLEWFAQKSNDKRCIEELAYLYIKINEPHCAFILAKRIGRKDLFQKIFENSLENGCLRLAENVVEEMNEEKEKYYLRVLEKYIKAGWKDDAKRLARKIGIK
jgi:hypothetical protein